MSIYIGEPLYTYDDFLKACETGDLKTVRKIFYRLHMPDQILVKGAKLSYDNDYKCVTKWLWDSHRNIREAIKAEGITF